MKNLLRYGNEGMPLIRHIPRISYLNIMACHVPETFGRVVHGVPGRDRTTNLVLRTDLLYPIELRGLNTIQNVPRGTF